MRSSEDSRISIKEGLGTRMERTKRTGELVLKLHWSNDHGFDLYVCFVLENDFGEGEVVGN